MLNEYTDFSIGDKGIDCLGAGQQAGCAMARTRPLDEFGIERNGQVGHGDSGLG